jgi:L-threonylcarbamoyladenylate synthase
VAAPSANRSGELSPTTAQHVMRSLGGRVDLTLDGGPTTSGIESTVLDMTVTPPRLLRPGPLAPADLEAILGPIDRPHAVAPERGPLRSPGMLSRHYAPHTPLELTVDDGAALVRELTQRGLRVGWVTFGRTPDRSDAAAVSRVLPADPAGAAAGLYASLHEMDAAGLDRIVVAVTPHGDEWLAVRDRLARMISASVGAHP